MSQMDRTLARRWPIQFIARKDSHGNFHALSDRDRHVFPFRSSHSTVSSIVPKTLPFFSSETPVTWGFVTSSFRQPMRTIAKCRRICGASGLFQSKSRARNALKGDIVEDAETKRSLRSCETIACFEPETNIKDMVQLAEYACGGTSL
ncbi:hypothetical protein V1477_007567 [Vespula maculifrons]|uniref:Uncharacterized protein n=1 Tax=Vespula maculifrons TaxID=7453 RepID=A0ABD2CIW5_VESMC